MREQDLEGKELEHRARLFKPWLEEEATKEYFNIVERKSIALVKHLRKIPFQKFPLPENETNLPRTRDECIARIHGQIDTCEMFHYLPIGVIKTYERYKKIEDQKKQEVKNGC